MRFTFPPYERKIAFPCHLPRLCWPPNTFLDNYPVSRAFYLGRHLNAFYRKPKTVFSRSATGAAPGRNLLKITRLIPKTAPAPKRHKSGIICGFSIVRGTESLPRGLIYCKKVPQRVPQKHKNIIIINSYALSPIRKREDAENTEKNRKQQTANRKLYSMATNG